MTRQNKLKKDLNFEDKANGKPVEQQDTFILTVDKIHNLLYKYKNLITCNTEVRVEMSNGNEETIETQNIDHHSAWDIVYDKREDILIVCSNY